MAVQRRRNNIGTSRRRRPVDDGEEEGSVAGQLDDDSLSEGSIGSAPEDDDADVEGSDESDDDRSDSSRADRTARGGLANANDRQELDMPAKPLSSCSPKQPIALAVSDTETVLNGVGDAASIHLDDLGLRRQPQPQSQSQSQPQLQPRMVAKPSTGRTPSAPPTESRRETFAEKKRQEHQKHTKERDENPAFVPTKGAFLRQHEKRSTESAPNGYRPFSKPSSRPFGLIVDGNVRRSAKVDATEGQWTHDLHSTVAGDDPPPPPAPRPSAMVHSGSALSAGGFSRPVVPTAPRTTPPNRSFSTTVLIGNVPVVVFLPGMTQPVSFGSVPKRQYTRLPQHRPPLRRDKPVRISLPGQSPRYIFPATERSFIFIPRALRPNQHGNMRLRGNRSQFYTSRRPSVYANTTYTPSVSMSRRSSLGRAPSQEGYPSPTGSVFSRQLGVSIDQGKPIVRLPPPARPGIASMPVVPMVAQPAKLTLVAAPAAAPVPPPPPPAPVAAVAAVAAPAPAAPAPAPATAAASASASAAAAPPQPAPVVHHPQFHNTVYRDSRPTPIPMHQPRPQKAVSVADIESPAGLSFHLHQPHYDQPFHQQVPVHVNGPPHYASDVPFVSHGPHASQGSVTPLSQIPERAIHAQPFQPFNYQQAQGFYPAPPYGPGAAAAAATAMYYPAPGPEFPGYSPNASVPPPPAAPSSFSSASQPGPPPPPPYLMSAAAQVQPSQPSTVAHEAGGTVYYYDASQVPMYTNPPPQFTAPGPGGVVGMGGMMTPPGTTYYYPQPPNGMLYYSGQ